ncbi:MAG: class I SAM-dependent methyltransferase [Geobacteraceae bacterium]|nr:class I SAM-dependent methyltransferase [Geobacteraceae bacterium]
MINYMLAKLESQMRQAVQLQQDGRFPAALGGYELICEALRFYEELGYGQEAENIHRLPLAVQPTPAMTLYCHALIQYYRRHYSSALEAIKAALAVSSEITMLHVLKARILTALGDLPGAHETYRFIQDRDPGYDGAHDSLFMLAAEQEMPGPDYYDWLERFHHWLRPATYVEIGLGHGRSLALAGPETRAIGIDPYQGAWEHLNYVCPHTPATLFPVTSDDFFVGHDLREVLERETFDLGFIDGLHLFEQALKDFINLERYARKDSVVLIHDCLPIAPIVAERERCTGFWTGDVWRIIPCLKTFRPDLKIMTIPTKPSGLGVVTNLDATSTVLSDNYDDIVRYYLTLRCPESFEQRRVVCRVGSADEEYVKEQFCGK